jgi:hypothetical protein
MIVAQVSAHRSQFDRQSDDRRAAYVSVRSERAARARNRKIESMLKTLQPMRGGLWLAFDRSTGFHWMLDVADVRLAPGVRYTGPGTGSAGVVTIRSRSGDPVFQIEEADTLVWDEPERTLRVREGGFRGAEIVLERIASLDALTLTIDESTTVSSTRSISVENGLCLPIDDSFVSTGDAEIDATLTVIESSIATRAGEAGALTSELVQGMTAQLTEISRKPGLRSYVWLVTLQQRLATLNQTSKN